MKVALCPLPTALLSRDRQGADLRAAANAEPGFRARPGKRTIGVDPVHQSFADQYFLTPDLPRTDAVVEVFRTSGLVTRIRVTQSSVAPALFVRRSDDRDYAAATHADGSAISGSERARVGETISVYASGLGPTNPPVESDRSFSGAAATVNPAIVRVGGVGALALFSGLVGPGLYQINRIVPALPPGDHVVEVEVDGSKSQRFVYLAVD